MSSANAVVPTKGAPIKKVSRGQDELAFLPAALEIVETPPSPLGHAIGVTIIAMFSVALAWACFGHIDIVATATGKTVPSGRTKVVQPFETGVVRAIHVQDGQPVTAGEVLIELDPTINEAERNHLRSDLATVQLDIARLKAVLGDDPDPSAAFRPPEEANRTLVAMQRQLLIHQVDEQRAKLAALDRQKAQKQAELATVTASVNKLEAVLPVLKQRVDIRELLYSHETGSKASYLEILQAYVETPSRATSPPRRYRASRAPRASRRDRNSSIPPASPSTARRCRWRKISSTSPPEWRSRWRSRPAPAPSSPTCCRRCCATSRRACGRGEARPQCRRRTSAFADCGRAARVPGVGEGPGAASRAAKNGQTCGPDRDWAVP